MFAVASAHLIQKLIAALLRLAEPLVALRYRDDRDAPGGRGGEIHVEI